VDEYGGTAGVISLEDILEELVGEIRDEYDNEEEERVIRKLEDGNYLIDGRANLSDVGEVVKVQFPDNELYDSLGGFLIATYGKMPETGTQIHFENLEFTVKQADAKRVIQVLVKKIVQESSPES